MFSFLYNFEYSRGFCKSHGLCGVLVDSNGRYSARKPHHVDAALFVVTYFYS